MFTSQLCANIRVRVGSEKSIRIVLVMETTQIAAVEGGYSHPSSYMYTL